MIVTDLGVTPSVFPKAGYRSSVINLLAHVGDLVVPYSVVAGVRRSTRLKILRDQKFGAQRLRTWPQ